MDVNIKHTIFQVASEHVNMDIASVIVIRRVQICQPRQKRTRISGKGMEVQAVYAYCNALDYEVRFSLLGNSCAWRPTKRIVPALASSKAPGNAVGRPCARMPIFYILRVCIAHRFWADIANI